MSPEEIIKSLDHVSQQSDRWLFVAAIAFILLGGVLIIRYLVKQNEKQSERHGALTEKVLLAWTESTLVIKEVRDWLVRNRKTDA